MADVVRSDWTERNTTVRIVAKPYGPNGKGYPPSLGDLRKFVAACEGLPDDTTVRINQESPGMDGRYANVELSVRVKHPTESEEADRG